MEHITKVIIQNRKTGEYIAVCTCGHRSRAGLAMDAIDKQKRHEDSMKELGE